MYSQNDEEKHILYYFAGKDDGRLLDIGAYDGKTFSNTKALIDRGWSGVMVEASPRCFASLMETYKGNDRVMLANALVGHGAGLVRFHDSMGACATSCDAQHARWAPHQKDFQTIYLPVLDVSDLMRAFGSDFDFISIDCEGMDWSILQRLPLKTMKTRMVCIEFGDQLDNITGYMVEAGFKMVFRNAENLIFVR